MSAVAECGTVAVRSLYGRCSNFKPGQRVRISKLGRLGLDLHSPAVVTGVVCGESPAYPDSIIVVRDGESSGLAYNKAYWEHLR